MCMSPDSVPAKSCLLRAGGMTEFRRSLVASFLFRLFAEAAIMLEGQADGSFSLASGSFPDSMRSAVVSKHREPATGIQYFSKAKEGAVVGRPDRHMAADLQASELFHTLSASCCCLALVIMVLLNA